MDSQTMHAPPDEKSAARAPSAGQTVDLSDPRCRERKPRFQSWDSDDNRSSNKKRKVLSSEGESGERHDSSSLSSFMTYSNFTMSCSGAETQEDNTPSTSGCSSFMAHKDKKRASKVEKKERVKQYLKELKSMVQPDGRGGTLSALQQVLTNMRKMKGNSKLSADALKPSQTAEKKAEQPSDTAISSHYALSQTVYDSMSHESLISDALKHSDEILIYLTARDNVVRAVSQNLKTVLGYQWDRWVGRSLDDFVHKYDIVTYKSIIKRSDESLLDSSDGEFASEKQKIFYIRLRECKSLNTTGFSLRKHDKYLPFQCSFIRKKMCKREMQAEANQSDVISSSGYSGSLMQWGGSSLESGSNEADTWYTILHCTPLVSPYTDPMRLPDVTSFETRQTLFCSFCHIEPNTIALLGYLPQEIVGVSIFEFYHNDDLQRLFTIYQKVIALQGVPYKSGTIRLLAKNGCWLSCVTEWSSFVNPWSKRLEFVIGKHTVVKGPENVDIFCERFTRPTVEETPHEVLLARQKIKNLLLQPVVTIYLGEENQKSQRPRPIVAIAEDIDYVSTAMSSEAATFKKDTILSCDPDKQALHGTGILFKENAISRAYEQLSYTSCIKKFLLSQPQCFSSDSEVRKSSSEDGFDDDSLVAINLSAGKPIGKWIKASIDDMVYNKRVKVPRLSEETRSLPSLNDAFWKNATIFSRDEFEFDISVPKPPSFGSSTKVLVSEQEHRDLENLPDPVVTTRDQLKQQQPPTPTTETTQTEAGRWPVMHLTRESLLNHTLMQEQLYLASASPERNVLFLNECRDVDSPVSHGRRNTLKRMHSPDMNFKQCKSGRNNEGQRIITPTSILNPVFPLHPFDSKDSFRSLVRVKQMVVPMQMYPIVSRSVTQFREGQQLPPGITSSSGMTFRQGEMMGFQTTDSSPRVTNVGLPIPVHQLNSYLMQQGNMLMPKMSTRPMRKLPESKLPVWTTSDTSSTEETLSSFYILESSGQPTRQYNEMVLQSLARQMGDPQHKGLHPAPWLQRVNFSDSMQYRYQLQCSKKQVLSKVFMEELAKMSQPIGVLEQIDEVLGVADGLPIIDQEHDDVIFNSELHNPCSCITATCCNKWNTEDHGISDMFKHMCKKGKKKEKHVKMSSKPKVMHKDAAMQTDFGFKMEMDEEAENETEAEIGARDGIVIDIQDSEMLGKSTKSDSCSNKSEDMFIRCDMSTDSGNSLNTSDITPSDQRSNNENGSSLKESDGDAMSKKSDSSSSDKQVISSESELDTKTSIIDELFESLFIDLAVCFPQCHSDMVPWLVDVDFDDNLQMNYHMECKDSELILQRDRTRIEAMGEPDLVRTQLCALMEDISSNADISSMMVGSEASSFVTDNLS
ncbi:period circadian protein homolog 2-like isoform X2 [Dreissena polymorpha]|uniref:period circadian protein homolog 2-like isoform X2 n=1 Tax=Dreissena polymorpha TaxID=45954 RepID=UPI002263EB19|nr:period circadian protein homolog 2-like isoform X2 [Dreissena polymorpha]